MNEFKIVTDSSSDMLSIEDIPFSAAPLKILTNEKEFVDNDNLDVKEMVDYLAEYKGKSSTSCPNPQDWINAFGDSKYIFCITISGTISGSHNAALIAKRIYEEKFPDRSVFVINSLSVGPEIKLIIEAITEKINAGSDYKTICKEISEYTKSTGLIFMLKSMKNLANNGRVSHLIARTVGLLGVRIIGKASDGGDLEILDKCRGKEKALKTIVNRMKEFNLDKGKIRIAHCFDKAAAEELKSLLLKALNTKNIEIYPCRGLCSFYAEAGGLLIGFEKF